MSSVIRDAAAGDPCVDLAEGRAYASLGDWTKQGEAAARSLAAAEARGEGPW